MHCLQVYYDMASSSPTPKPTSTGVPWLLLTAAGSGVFAVVVLCAGAFLMHSSKVHCE